MSTDNFFVAKIKYGDDIITYDFDKRCKKVEVWEGCMVFEEIHDEKTYTTLLIVPMNNVVAISNNVINKPTIELEDMLSEYKNYNAIGKKQTDIQNGKINQVVTDEF